MDNNRKLALLQHLDLDKKELENIKQDEHEENQYNYGKEEYLVLTEEEANDKAKEEILNSLWAFTPHFILQHANTDNMDNWEYDGAIEALKDAQAKLAERLNGLVRALIVDINEFVDDAICEDGRGHFISFYDGYENEEKVNGTMYYIYRMN